MTPAQVAQLEAILDDTKAKVKAVRELYHPQMLKIKQEQISRVKSILTPEQIPAYEQLVAERDRLRRARATLTGESPIGRISRDDVGSYLGEHPGARPGEIAKALGVASGTVSAHLLRGKQSRFVSRGGEWFLREQLKRGRR